MREEKTALGTVVVASVKGLKKLGWKKCERKLVPRGWYPTSDDIILEKDGEGLQHVYSVGEWDSDYPGESAEVDWHRIRFEPVQLDRVVRVDEGVLSAKHVAREGSR